MPLPPNARLFVFWIIWFTLLSSSILIQLVIGRGLPLGSNSPSATLSPLAIGALVQIMGSAVVRWLFIPRTVDPARLLVLMIVGLALSESAGFFGIFLIPSDQPQTKLTVLILSFLGMLQFAPLYANRAIITPATAFRR